MEQYGSEKVLPYNDEEHKGSQVRRMFDAIAGKYDLLNHTLSFGIDKIWRGKGIAYLRPFSPKAILDIATGTGDLAIAMYDKLHPDYVIGADLSEEGLAEMFRVLRPGGHLMVLELSTPERFPMRQLYQIYSTTVIPIVGRILSKEKAAYSYLPASIKVVPQGKVMTDLLTRVGFQNAQARTFTFGICSLYTGSKNN